MTVAPAPPRPVATVTAPRGVGTSPDLLGHLWAPATPRPVVDAGLAGGLRAWLEDGVAMPSRPLGDGPDARRDLAVVRGAIVRGAIVRDGELVTGGGVTGGVVTGGVTRGVPGRGTGILPRDLRSWLTRTLFRLAVTDGPPRQPFEEALRAVSVTERGQSVLDAIRTLHPRERAALRAFASDRAHTISARWRPAPAAWLPRTGERLRVPLGGGTVTLTSSADLVLGRPSEGSASVCLLRVRDERDAGGTEHAMRTCRALALTETLRSGAPPWRVAVYDAGTGRLHREDVSVALLAAAVRDVLCALAVHRVP